VANFGSSAWLISRLYTKEFQGVWREMVVANLDRSACSVSRLYEVRLINDESEGMRKERVGGRMRMPEFAYSV
jgi:hypothetical protein